MCLGLDRLDQLDPSRRHATKRHELAVQVKSCVCSEFLVQLEGKRSEDDEKEGGGGGGGEKEEEEEEKITQMRK